jgi:hypothetical protein
MAAAKKEQQDEQQDPGMEGMTLDLFNNASTQVDRMVAIVASLKERAGTQSAILKAAGLDALAQPINVGEAIDLADLSAVDYFAQVETLGDLANWLVEAQDWATQMHDEAVKVLVQQRGVTTGDETALREEFTSLGEQVGAFLVLADGLGVPTDAKDALVAKVPTLKGVKSASTGTTRTVSTKGQVFGRIVQGEDLPQSAQQNSMSSMCYYHWHKPGFPWGNKKDGAKPTTEDFRTFLAGKVGRPADTLDTQDWEAEVGGVTYYLRIEAKGDEA